MLIYDWRSFPPKMEAPAASNGSAKNGDSNVTDKTEASPIKKSEAAPPRFENDGFNVNEYGIQNFVNRIVVYHRFYRKN